MDLLVVHGGHDLMLLNPRSFEQQMIGYTRIYDVEMSGCLNGSYDPVKVDVVKGE